MLFTGSTKTSNLCTTDTRVLSGLGDWYESATINVIERRYYV